MRDVFARLKAVERQEEISVLAIEYKKAKMEGRRTKDIHLTSADRYRRQHQTETAADVAAIEAGPARRNAETCSIMQRQGC